MIRRVRLPLLVLCLALGAGSTASAAPDLDAIEDRIDRHAKDPFEQDQRQRAIRDAAKLGTVAALKRLPDLMKRVRRLERRARAEGDPESPEDAS